MVGAWFHLSVAVLCLGVAIAQPAPGAPSRVVTIDRVVAVVNDEAITQYDLDDAKRIVLQQLKQQNVQPPSADVLDKQVLERLMTERSLLQLAKENGVKVDDTQIERAMQRIAQENKLSAEDFRKALANENITYAKYREDIRNELTMQRLRSRQALTRSKAGAGGPKRRCARSRREATLRRLPRDSPMRPTRFQGATSDGGPARVCRPSLWMKCAR